MMWRWHQAFLKKVQKPFSTFLYPHLTLSPSDDVLKFSWLYKFPTCSGCRKTWFKMNRVWNGLCWRDSRVWRNFGKFKILQIRYYRNICLHLRHSIFRLCHSVCWGFLVTLMLQAKNNLCDFSLVRTETVYVTEAAVFCTWLCSVIAAKEV